MRDVVDRLKKDFSDPEYRHIYDEGFLNSSIATQIKVLREERNWTQALLADSSGMNQSRVSELEDVNFNSWTIRTLRKLARAYDLRLKISFEEFGTLLHDFRNLNRAGLTRRSFASDPEFCTNATVYNPTTVHEERGARIAPATIGYPSQWLTVKWPANQHATLQQTEQVTTTITISGSLTRKGPGVAVELKNDDLYYAMTPDTSTPTSCSQAAFARP